MFVPDISSIYHFKNAEVNFVGHSPWAWHFCLCRANAPCWAIALLDTLFKAISFHLLLKIPPKYGEIIVNRLIAICFHLGLCCLVNHWPIMSGKFLCVLESHLETELSLLLPFPAAALLAAQPSWLQPLALPSRTGLANSASTPLLVISIPRDNWWLVLLMVLSYLILFSFQQDSLTWKKRQNKQTKQNFPKELFILVDLTKYPNYVGGGKTLCTSFLQPFWKAQLT